VAVGRIASTGSASSRLNSPEQQKQLLALSKKTRIPQGALLGETLEDLLQKYASRKQ
jgi:hypothetical protein